MDGLFEMQKRPPSPISGWAAKYETSFLVGVMAATLVAKPFILRVKRRWSHFIVFLTASSYSLIVVAFEGLKILVSVEVPTFSNFLWGSVEVSKFSNFDWGSKS